MSLGPASSAQVAAWWRTFAEHEPRDGQCPVCRTRRRCWERAAAMAELVAHDVYHLGPPASGPGPA